MDMRIQMIGILLVVSLVALPMLLGLASQDSTIQSGQHNLPDVIIAEQCSFEPSDVVVKVGQTVRIGVLSSMVASASDSILIPALGIAKPITGSGPTFVEVTPDTPGEYPFWCSACQSGGLVTVTL
jgi:plastocyanin domain-containing protein